MATYAAFVTTQYIKNNTPIIAYVEDDELQPFIKVAQDTHIQKTLGTNLFNDLKTKVLNNSLNSDEVSLMNDYVQPATSWCVVYEFILFNHYKITNKGITKQNSENSVSAELNEVNFLRDDTKNKSEFFKDRLCKYLMANPSLFPLYYGGDINVDTIQPSHKNFYSGLYTGKRRYNSGCVDCPIGPNTWIDLSGKFGN